MFDITPEPFNAIDMTPPLRSPRLFPHHNMVSSDCQRPVGLPVVGIVKTARLCVLLNKPDDLARVPALNGKNPNRSVSLQDPQHDDFACGTPAAFALSAPATCGLVALKSACKRLTALSLKGKSCSNQPKESFHRCHRAVNPKTHPVHGNTQNKQLKQSPLGSLWQTTCPPYRDPAVACSTSLALESPVPQVPGSFTSACRTTSHDQIMLPNLVRFG